MRKHQIERGEDSKSWIGYEPHAFPFVNRRFDKVILIGFVTSIQARDNFSPFPTHPTYNNLNHNISKLHILWQCHKKNSDRSTSSYFYLFTHQRIVFTMNKNKNKVNKCQFRANF